LARPEADFLFLAGNKYQAGGKNMWRGQKVLLRAMERRDIETFRKMLNDPEINQYLLVFTPLSEIAEEKWFEKIAQSSTEIVMAIKNYDFSRPRQIIGNCGFHGINWKDRTATFGIFIGNPVFWNNGYGSEAARLLFRHGFEQMNLHRINSSVIGFNERSLKMHEKLGFEIEGRRRQNIFKNGAYHDEVIFGLLREDWEKSQA